MNRTASLNANGLNDLRQATALELTIVLLGLAWLVALAAIGYRGDLRGLGVAALLLTGAALTLWVRQRRLSAALTLLVVTGLGAIAAHKALFPESPSQFLFPVVVVSGSLLVSGVGVYGIAALASVLCVFVARLNGFGWLDETQVTFPVFLNGLTAFAAWLGSRQMHVALAWMENSYTRSLDLLDQLRDEQMRLASTVKMLEDAYYRITKLNSALNEARSAAETARRLKAEFAANISHELRTPLNLVIGFSETMANAPETYAGVQWTPTLRGDVEHIYRSSRYLSALIDDILDLSALEVNQLGLNFELAALPQVVEDSLAVIADLYHAKHLYLKVDVEPHLPLVRMDTTRIRQVMLNLLTNAIRFTPAGGVTVRVAAAERELIVSVADTGIGIAAADIPRVFEEFGQVDGSTTRAHEGTGLGVPLSKRLVELHGGRMWLESRPRVGTTFFFTLPAQPDAGRAMPGANGQRPAAAVPEADGRKTLVVLEPDPVLLRTMRRHLSGYDVIAASGAAELDTLVARAQPAAVVIDQPAQAVPSLPDLPPDLPVVQVSLAGSLSRARQLGIESYLLKPVSREDLLSAIDTLAAQPRDVLVVDDDEELVELLCRMLQSFQRDYRVSKAFSGEDALTHMRRQRPGLVLLDLELPGQSGLEVLAEMQRDALLKALPVIVISAQSPETPEAEAGLQMVVSRGAPASAGETLACLKPLLDGLPRRDLQSAAAPPAPRAVPDAQLVS
jgi:signal transduction histidine kinase/DNA-binding response OmpR family regulator